MGLDLHVDLFYGFVTREAPWQPGPARPDEWPDERRLRLVGPDPDARLERCEIAVDPERRSPWWVFVRASLKTASDLEASALADPVADPAWEAWLRDFCDLLEIAYQEPGWCLLSRIT